MIDHCILYIKYILKYYQIFEIDNIEINVCKMYDN